jgi:hypothetical protein
VSFCFTNASIQSWENEGEVEKGKINPTNSVSNDEKPLRASN